MFRQRFRPYLESDNVMFTFIKVFIVCLLCYIGIDPTLYFSSIFYIMLLFFFFLFIIRHSFSSNNIIIFI